MTTPLDPIDTIRTVLDGGTAPVDTPAIPATMTLHLREYLLIKMEYTALLLGSTDIYILIILIIIGYYMTFLSK